MRVCLFLSCLRSAQSAFEALEGVNGGLTLSQHFYYKAIFRARAYSLYTYIIQSGDDDDDDNDDDNGKSELGD